jgi:hypothetical protein
MTKALSIPENLDGDDLHSVGEEEVPMTFQLGIVGRGGEVLLASDLLHTDNAEYNRTTYLAPKIETSGNVACCSAGAKHAQIASDQIIRGLGSAEPTNLKVWIQEKVTPSAGPHGGSVLVAYRREYTVELWTVRVGDGIPLADQVLSRTVQGDKSNSAGFVLERYLPAEKVLLPLSRLLVIAAHTVLMAGKINSSGVAGLEIVLCRPSGFERLGAVEVAQLTAQSAKLDAGISAVLGLEGNDF